MRRRDAKSLDVNEKGSTTVTAATTTLNGKPLEKQRVKLRKNLVVAKPGYLDLRTELQRRQAVNYNNAEIRSKLDGIVRDRASQGEAVLNLRRAELNACAQLRGAEKVLRLMRKAETLARDVARECVDLDCREILDQMAEFEKGSKR